MIACPLPEALRDLMSGSLPGGDADRLRDHLATCADCLGELDRLSDDPGLARWMAEGGDPSCDTTSRSFVRDRIRAARDAARTSSGRPIDVLRGLEPPDREGDLGRIGAYRIEAILGRGGMGVVVRGFDEALQRVVALKVFDPGLADAAARAGFVREARAAAKVEHDHIVRIYAVADPGDDPSYLVMEYLDGATLADTIRLQGRIPPREAARVVAEVADGLAAAHAAGLIHRDIKPSNILFETATGRAKIVDFGLARAAARPIIETREGTICGTPAYMSPEQARGQDDLDGRSDLYNLGASLYEALTGDLPFRGAPQMVLRQVLDDEPKPPRRLNDAVPRDLETVCLKAMAKEPSRRYESAAELAADLRRWLAGAPIRARPVGPIERSWRLCRRHPKVTALATAFLLATIAGVAGVVWQWRRAEANAREATVYLRKTLESIDEYFVKVSEDRLLDVPNLQPLRKELLNDARDYYQALLRDRPGDPAIRVELAKARSSLAGVVSLIGGQTESVTLYRQSLEEFDRIVERSPRDEAARLARLACLTNLGKVLMLASKYDEARATYRRLLAEAEALNRERPGLDEPLQASYAARHGLGSASFFQNVEPQRMFADYEAAERINGTLLVRKPDSLVYLRNLSRTAGMLAVAYANHGRRDAARDALGRSYNVTRKLVADHPESQDYRFALASLERQRAMLPLEQSLALKGSAAKEKLDQSRRAFAEAIAIDRALIRENPRLDAYRFDYLTVLLIAATVEAASGRSREGLAMLQEARKVHAEIANSGGDMSFLKPTLVAILAGTAQAHSEEGRADEALEVLDDADRLIAALSTSERATAGSVPQDIVVACIRAGVLGEARRQAESVAAWDRATGLAPTALRPLVAFFGEMQQAEAPDGSKPDPRRALAVVPLADAVCGSAPMSGVTLVSYARLYALAAAAAVDPAGRESLDARAILLLEKAWDAGYFRQPSRLERVESDPVFFRLRERRNFQEFLRIAR